MTRKGEKRGKELDTPPKYPEDATDVEQDMTPLLDEDAISDDLD